jgi:DNA-binding transcriptional MerR regulator
MTAATFNINEASKACGLSPSVLRIWELRYNWPSPRRKANGYRAYSHHQIEELKRIAELVKNGMPISQLIIDGLPRWPTDQVRRRTPQGLKHARLLPRPAGHLEGRLQGEIVDALEKRLSSVVKELLQRAMWSVRPQDELVTALAPVLIGLRELAADERALPDEIEVRRLVAERCQQLLRRFRSTPGSVRVQPATPDDTALAALIALALNQRGTPAAVWQPGGAPAHGPLIVAGVGDGTAPLRIRRITDLPGHHGESLNDLLTAGYGAPTPVLTSAN